MAKPYRKELVVVRSTQLTEHMLRITLGGEQLAYLPEDQESAYIKLVFPQGKDERPLMRTYTIRHQRQTEIDVDFALHDQKGPFETSLLNRAPRVLLRSIVSAIAYKPNR